MKKIVFVINYFYPDLASTGQLMTELCRELQDEFDITVIAAQPGYAGEKSNNKQNYEVEHLEKIKVVRIKLPIVEKSHKISRIKYIFSYFFKALYALLKEKNVDIIYTISQPPILGGLIGTIGKILKSVKHIYNIQDFNPEQAEAVGYSKFKLIYTFSRKIDNFTCKQADHVVLVGNDMIETLKERMNKTPNYTVINNWTDERDIVPLDRNNEEVLSFKKENELTGKFIIMYSGNLGLYYDLENIIKVSKELQEYKDLIFVFIGEGAVKKQMSKYVRENGVNNVLFFPYQPKDFIKYSLNAADIHFVVNQKGIKGVSVPSKIYGVMAVGKPILGVLEKESEAERLVSLSNCGIVVEPGNYDLIIKTIKKLYEMSEEERERMGLNGRAYLEANLSKKKSIEKYKELFRKI